MAQQSTPPSQSDVPEQSVDPEQSNVAEVDVCCHHWSIQPATGPVSPGVCQVCGEIREFKNYVEAATWGDSRLSKRANTEESKGTVKPLATAAKGEDDEEEEN